MRPIKFRAWHKTLKRWLSHEEFYIDSIGRVFTTQYSGMGEPHTDISNDVELVQFTGLLDKNGKEIYEGDIVKLVHINCEGDGWISKSNERGVVYFDVNWGVKFDCRDKTQRTADMWRSGLCEKHWSDHEMPRDYTNIEVIGNIYENPNLLNKI